MALLCVPNHERSALITIEIHIVSQENTGLHLWYNEYNDTSK